MLVWNLSNSTWKLASPKDLPQGRNLWMQIQITMAYEPFTKYAVLDVSDSGSGKTNNHIAIRSNQIRNGAIGMWIVNNDQRVFSGSCLHVYSR